MSCGASDVRGKADKSEIYKQGSNRIDFSLPRTPTTVVTIERENNGTKNCANRECNPHPCAPQTKAGIMEKE